MMKTYNDSNDAIMVHVHYSAGRVESISSSNSAAYTQADNAISSAISDAVAKVTS